MGRTGAAEGRLADASPAKGAVSASLKSRPEASALKSVMVYDGALDIGEEPPVGATGVRWAGSVVVAGIAFLCSLTRLGRKTMRPATCLVGVLRSRNAWSMSDERIPGRTGVHGDAGHDDRALRPPTRGRRRARGPACTGCRCA